jgi:hypothetical protein
MIKDFEKIKEQLSELAGVINAFKSEAVQLRLIDLIFELPSSEEESKSETNIKKKTRSSQKPKTTKKKAAGKQGRSNSNAPKKTAPVGTGAVAILSQLATSDFFNEPKTINDIVTHCSTNLARHFKTNAFSGKLARMVRNGELTRTKNSENQYEYKKS